jgi:hypothetical protein
MAEGDAPTATPTTAVHVPADAQRAAELMKEVESLPSPQEDTVVLAFEL